MIECKKSSVDVEEGVKQNIRNWQPDYIPQLFKFTQLAIAMNPETVKYGTAGTKQEFYCKWHEEDVQWQEEAAKRYVRPSDRIYAFQETPVEYYPVLYSV